MDYIGIVILNFNSSDITILTIESIVAAKTNISFEIVLVDNGSTIDEYQVLENYYKKKLASNDFFKTTLISNKENKGFSGGNNIAIKRLIEDKNITHICLLNSDVIVTDYWLDRLLSRRVDAIGPVSNAVGNEQTVPINYSVKPEISCIDQIRMYADEWYKLWNNSTTETDFLGFFCVCLTRKLVESVGLLDERFFPGSYEDDDYCIRILNHGFKMFIARDVFLHHWGSQSFSKLIMDNRVIIGNDNRKRFEEKWGQPWEDRTFKLVKSCRQDVNYLLENNHVLLKQKTIINDYFENLEGLVNTLVKQNESLQKTIEEERYNSFLAHNGGIIRKLIPYSSKKLLKLIINNFGKSIAVFAPFYDTARLKDGYFKRVKAVDDLFKDKLKIHITTDKGSVHRLQIELLKEDLVIIRYSPFSKLQQLQIAVLTLLIGKIYMHSIWRFHKGALALPFIKKIIDVHGAVPEEFRLSKDFFNGQLYEEKEEYALKHADCIVVVTNAMKNHLQNKYQLSKNIAWITMPIFDADIDYTEQSSSKNEPIRVIYAGGIQKWQKIEYMNEVIKTSKAKVEYRIFVPNIVEYMKTLEGVKIDNLLVNTKNRDELIIEYRKAHYGFILRDDITVNHVACPTKLIEYMQYGIVPIMLSPRIGDFFDMGLEYIPVEEFIKGILPNEEKRILMANHNRILLHQFKQQFDSGKQLLRQLI